MDHGEDLIFLIMICEKLAFFLLNINNFVKRCFIKKNLKSV